MARRPVVRKRSRPRESSQETAVGPARITSKYQVTIPQPVRADMGTEVGDLLLFVKEGAATWRILRVPRDPVEALRLAGQGLTGTPEEVHREFEAGWRDEQRE